MIECKHQSAKKISQAATKMWEQDAQHCDFPESAEGNRMAPPLKAARSLVEPGSVGDNIR